MFDNSTVFVLGAGVSVPYGFPSGIGLVDAICKGSTSRRIVIPQILKQALPGRHIEIDAFLTALRESQPYSIDRWLESNPKYMDMGKLAIALVIADAEKTSLHKEVEPHEDWFRWICQAMLTDKIKDLVKNNITFLTFNYDRLAERTLSRFITHHYLEASPTERTEAIEQVSRKILHVHGMLKYNPVPNHNGSYGCISIEDMFRPEAGGRRNEAAALAHYMAQTIKIISEDDHDKAILAQASAAFAVAQKIIFLGFGYDSRNLSRIGMAVKRNDVTALPPVNPNTDPLNYPIIGSAMGLELAQRRSIKNFCNGRIYLDEDGLNAKQFCDRYVTLQP